MKLHVIWKHLIYLRYPILLIAYHSLILFNPCVKVKICACQYFFLSHKILSISSPFLAKKLAQLTEPASIPFYKYHRQLFSFIILGNKDGDMSSFKFLFLLYVTFLVFSGKICSISWLLCNTGKYFLKILLILGSIGLYCVIKLHVVEKLLLILGLLASSLEIFLTSENCFLTLVGL